MAWRSNGRKREEEKSEKTETRGNSDRVREPGERGGGGEKEEEREGKEFTRNTCTNFRQFHRCKETRKRSRMVVRSLRDSIENYSLTLPPESSMENWGSKLLRYSFLFIIYIRSNRLEFRMNYQFIR